MTGDFRDLGRRREGPWDAKAGQIVHNHRDMSKALMKKGSSSSSTMSGAVPAVASLIIPGTGQLINGEGSKALGVFVVWGVAGLGFLGALPLIGSVAGLVGAATHIYAVADGYLTGKKKRG